MDIDDREARRDARTVETVLALGLGLAAFLALVLVGWLLDRVLRLAFGLSLVPAQPALLVGAVVVAGGVVVVHLARSERRGGRR